MEIKKHPRCDGNSRRKLCTLKCDLCFSRSFESTDNADLWHESNIVTARDVFKKSEKEYNFFCKICNHLFVSTPGKMSAANCPFCSVPPKRMCEKEDCIKCFEKTIASEELKDKWSENNEVTPRQVFKGSNTKYKFICSNEKCGHEYEKCFVKKTGCPYCTKGGRKLCDAGAGACKICYKTSFALSHRAKFWSPKNEGKPCDYTMSTTKKFLFDCPDCGHEFSTALSKITYYNRWCPYCAVPSKKFCGTDACKFCSKRTFATLADPEKLKRYSNKNPKRPDFFYQSRKMKL